MRSFAILSLFLTCLLATYVGTRTLFVWRRTHMLPELGIGLSMVSLAGGVVLILAIDNTPALQTLPFSYAGWIIGRFALALSIASLYVVIWRVFRPTDAWAALLAAAGTATAIAYLALRIGTGGLGVPTDSLSTALLEGSRFVLYLWAALESFHYSALLRRRVAIGLAEPMMAHRMMLWGVGSAAQVVGIVITCYSSVVLQATILGWAPGVLITSLMGVTGSLAIALAFFPPSWYARLVTGESRAQAAL